MSEDGQGTFVGPPECVLVTADVRFNDARNQSARTWAESTGHVSINASGVRLWITTAAEATARANPNAPAVPSALLTEHESRCREGDSEDEEMGNQLGCCRARPPAPQGLCVLAGNSFVVALHHTNNKTTTNTHPKKYRDTTQ